MCSVNFYVSHTINNMHVTKNYVNQDPSAKEPFPLIKENIFLVYKLHWNSRFNYYYKSAYIGIIYSKRYKRFFFSG